MDLVTRLFENFCKDQYYEDLLNLGEVDQMYFTELAEILEKHSADPFKIYIELTYFYVRYTKCTMLYKDIPTHIEPNTNNILVLLVGVLKSFAASNILEFLDKIFMISKGVVLAAVRPGKVCSEKIVKEIEKFTFTEYPEEKNAYLESSLCEIAEYFSFVKGFIAKEMCAEGDLEFLIAVNVYFGYFKEDSTVKWDECTEIMVKIFDTYTNEPKVMDFLDYKGFKIFELFKVNEALPKMFLRDVSKNSLVGILYRYHVLLKELNDIKESIDREEFSMENLNKCKENLREAENIYYVFIFLPWNSANFNLRDAEKLVVFYNWAIVKLEKLKD